MPFHQYSGFAPVFHIRHLVKYCHHSTLLSGNLALLQDFKLFLIDSPSTNRYTCQMMRNTSTESCNSFPFFALEPSIQNYVAVVSESFFIVGRGEDSTSRRR